MDANFDPGSDALLRDMCEHADPRISMRAATRAIRHERLRSVKGTGQLACALGPVFALLTRSRPVVAGVGVSRGTRLWLAEDPPSGWFTMP